MRRLGASEGVVWSTTVAGGVLVALRGPGLAIAVAALLVCVMWAALCSAAMNGVSPLIVVTDEPTRTGIWDRALDVLGLGVPALD